MGENPLFYYAQHGFLTDPGPSAPLLDGLPDDLPGLVRVVQGLLLHIFWAERYGQTLTKEREKEVNIRAVADMLSRVQALDDAPLIEPRVLEQRLVGNCRDFTLLLCALLRQRGVPARARCGFGTYFLPDHFEDHWVCEYWHAGQGRWVLVDAQLDAFQQRELGIDFDPLDVPRDRFVVAGRGWQMCRAGEADADHFGIFDMHGMWFIRGNLLRDFWSLNQIEVLPWDGWGLCIKDEDELTAQDMALLDRMADLTAPDEVAFAEIRALYASTPQLPMPPDWKAFGDRLCDQ